MEDILSVVRASLVTPAPTTIPTTEEDADAGGAPQIFLEEEQKWDDDEGGGGGVEELVYPHDSEYLFDDTGEGVGVEGDLDMEDE